MPWSRRWFISTANMSCITVLSEKGKALKAKEDKAKDDLFDLGVKEKDNTSKKLQGKGGRRYWQYLRQSRDWDLEYIRTSENQQEKDNIPSRKVGKGNEQAIYKTRRSLRANEHRTRYAKLGKWTKKKTIKRCNLYLLGRQKLASWTVPSVGRAVGTWGAFCTAGEGTGCEDLEKTVAPFGPIKHTHIHSILAILLQGIDRKEFSWRSIKGHGWVRSRQCCFWWQGAEENLGVPHWKLQNHRDG